MLVLKFSMGLGTIYSSLCRKASHSAGYYLIYCNIVDDMFSYVDCIPRSACGVCNMETIELFLDLKLSRIVRRRHSTYSHVLRQYQTYTRCMWYAWSTGDVCGTGRDREKPIFLLSVTDGKVAFRILCSPYGVGVVSMTGAVCNCRSR
jgi:hypothetical protein